ncbi:C-terminal helicase domain-containing protein, partial [Roseomonas sp. DSM 102946]|nr:C-terminal helicase domain-containing protein [Roseomonas sp. DSM 102946]
FSTVALSGELSQSERTRALQSLRDGRARVCVATDVAARGIDLPDLGLVIHAELPRDPETLTHRSGRTGRAGRKGISVLLVPYNRRRTGERLLAAARVQASWGPPPSAETIRAKDNERLSVQAGELVAEEAAEDDLALARGLLEK